MLRFRPTIQPNIFHHNLHSIAINRNRHDVDSRPVSHIDSYYPASIHKWHFCSISALFSKYNSRNINHLSVIMFFAWPCSKSGIFDLILVKIIIYGWALSNLFLDEGGNISQNLTRTGMRILSALQCFLDFGLYLRYIAE